MSCPAIEDRLFEDCAINPCGTETPIELAFEPRRVYNLAHICGIHHTDEVYLPCFCIDLNLYKAHHAVTHSKIRVKTPIATYGPVVSHGPPLHVLFRMTLHKYHPIGRIEVLRIRVKFACTHFKDLSFCVFCRIDDSTPNGIGPSGTNRSELKRGH